MLFARPGSCVCPGSCTTARRSMFMRTRKEWSVSEAEAPSLRGRVVAAVHLELLEYGGDVVGDRPGDRISRSAMSALANRPQAGAGSPPPSGETVQVLDHFLLRPARYTPRRGPVASV